MTDIMSREKRSYLMSRIRGKNTKIELSLKEKLESAGLDFEMHPKMIGNPDFILKQQKLAIFCDGDFWHGYRLGPKKLSKMSKYWSKKIVRNKVNAKKADKILQKGGWKVLRFWEHQIEKDVDWCIGKIIKELKSL